MRNRIIGGLVLAVALTACGTGDQAGTTASPTTSTRRLASTGTITIIEPAPGASVKGPDVTVRVKVEGATIIVSGEASRDIRPDTGHVHVLQKLFGTGGDGRTETLLAGEEYTIENLAPGQYVITAEFVAADHGKFEPRVRDSVTITVT